MLTDWNLSRRRYLSWQVGSAPGSSNACIPKAFKSSAAKWADAESDVTTKRGASHCLPQAAANRVLAEPQSPPHSSVPQDCFPHREAKSWNDAVRRSRSTGKVVLSLLALIFMRAAGNHGIRRAQLVFYRRSGDTSVYVATRKERRCFWLSQ